MQRKSTWLCLAVLAVSIPACVRTVLNQEKTFSIEPGTVQVLTIEPVSREQKVNVEFTSEPASVSVYVVLEKDLQSAQNDLLSKQKGLAGALAGADKSSGGTFEAVVPARSAAVVLVGRASKGTKVTIKLTN